MREIRARGTVGSNQWAVDGSVTDTGNPIYANDPHLGLGSPSTFYELHVNTKDRGGNLNATGIGFAGAPGVVQGHNESIAWGSTTNPADVTDWYLEDMSTDGTGKLFSHYQGNPEAVVEAPILVKVNMENGNEPIGRIERTVIAVASGVPVNSGAEHLQRDQAARQLRAAASDRDPAPRADLPADPHHRLLGSGRESLPAEPGRHRAHGQVHRQLRDP